MAEQRNVRFHFNDIECLIKDIIDVRCENHDYAEIDGQRLTPDGLKEIFSTLFVYASGLFRIARGLSLLRNHDAITDQDVRDAAIMSARGVENSLNLEWSDDLGNY